MTETLSGVVRTQTLGTCGREMLGKFCVAPDYPCLCEDAVSTNIVVEHDDKGAAVVILTIERDKFAGNETDNIRKNVELLGYRTSWETKSAGLEHGSTIKLTFDLAQQMNRELRDYIVAFGV